MDGLLSNLKKFISRSDDENSSDSCGTQEVRETLAKTDPDTFVDPDEMTQLAGATSALHKLDDIKTRPSKVEVQSSALPSITNPVAAADSGSVNVLQKPSNSQPEERWQEEHKGNEFKNPIEDDIFIYYD